MVDVAVRVDGGVQRGRVPSARTASWTCGAKSALPVSTSTSPSSVAKALTLAKDGTKATPSATSSASPDREKGCVSSILRAPVQRSSAMSRMPMAASVPLVDAGEAQQRGDSPDHGPTRPGDREPTPDPQLLHRLERAERVHARQHLLGPSLVEHPGLGGELRRDLLGEQVAALADLLGDLGENGARSMAARMDGASLLWSTRR